MGAGGAPAWRHRARRSCTAAAAPPTEPGRDGHGERERVSAALRSKGCTNRGDKGASAHLCFLEARVDAGRGPQRELDGDVGLVRAVQLLARPRHRVAGTARGRQSEEGLGHRTDQGQDNNATTHRSMPCSGHTRSRIFTSPMSNPPLPGTPRPCTRCASVG